MAVFLDLSKAFVTFDRQFMFMSLPALPRLRSYLSGQSQYLGINEDCSSLFSMELEVAQGSGSELDKFERVDKGSEDGRMDGSFGQMGVG